MALYVEPLGGSELDRLITALLNATGAIHQVVETELRDGGDGLAVIDRSAERLRGMLQVIAEHHGDRELAVITEFLAIATMLIANEAGFGEVFRIGGDDDFDDPDDPDDLHADWV